MLLFYCQVLRHCSCFNVLLTSFTTVLFFTVKSYNCDVVILSRFTTVLFFCCQVLRLSCLLSSSKIVLLFYCQVVRLRCCSTVKSHDFVVVLQSSCKTTLLFYCQVLRLCCCSTFKSQDCVVLLSTRKTVLLFYCQVARLLLFCSKVVQLCCSFTDKWCNLVFVVLRSNYGPDGLLLQHRNLAVTLARPFHHKRNKIGLWKFDFLLRRLPLPWWISQPTTETHRVTLSTGFACTCCNKPQKSSKELDQAVKDLVHGLW